MIPVALLLVLHAFRFPPVWQHLSAVRILTRRGQFIKADMAATELWMQVRTPRAFTLIECTERLKTRCSAKERHIRVRAVLAACDRIDSSRDRLED